MVTNTEDLSPIELCKKCIAQRENFVLQGGAGSGKTESLKELLLYMQTNIPNERVVCITHTNVAVDEIRSRVGDKFYVSTIHSFLNDLIKDYKKNIKSVIVNLFTVPEIVTCELEEVVLESEYKKEEYEKYKKSYKKYANKLFDLRHETCEKVIGKRDYDKNPKSYNQLLNEKITELNNEICSIIDKKDFTKIIYNETKFNSFKDLSYGHDGLLEIFHLLIEKYELLSRLIADRYDYIFIDEYQDTNSKIIDDFIKISRNYNLTIGLFGDSMQSIYSDGIGDVERYISESVLTKIDKPDNFRCSPEVIEMINSLRLDSLLQKVALKKLDNGQIEQESERQGNVKFFYSVYNKKPTAFSANEEKDKYLNYVDLLIKKVQETSEDAKVLMLTNKAISDKNGFKNLYEVFNERYPDVNDRIEDYLRSIQVLDVSDICQAYVKRDYNSLIKSIRNGGYIVNTSQDKQTLHDYLEILENSDMSLWETVKYAMANKLIKKTENYDNILKRNNEFLNQLKEDKDYQEFKVLYLAGNHSFSQELKDLGTIRSEEEFKSYENNYKKERFLEKIFSKEVKFKEVLNYAKYINEETNYITMHKTKGSSIDSVIVVMEEFFWNDYDFSLLYEEVEQNKVKKKQNSQKLIYVACSRAKKDLTCLRVLESNEVELFLKKFPMAKRIDVV